MTDHQSDHDSRIVTASRHDAEIEDQFTRQAEPFARARELHNDDALALIVEAAQPQPAETGLDVACGPGTVVAALAPRLARMVGIDSTEAMLEQARRLAAARGLANVAWQHGDVYRLPFADAAFDIVTCRFAFHHLDEPARAFAEMVRVCRPSGRIVLCDAVASDDLAKAAAFNAMERHRDPSTVEMRPLTALLDLYAGAGLTTPAMRRFAVRYEREALIAKSFPAGDDREGLRRMIDQSVSGDRMGMEARRRGETVYLSYSAVVLVAARSAARAP